MADKTSAAGLQIPGRKPPANRSLEARREAEMWAALAPSTRLRYRFALKGLDAWLQAHGGAASDVEDLCDFLQQRADLGYGAGLAIVVAALTFWQRARGAPVTASDPAVRAVLKRLRRETAQARQASPLAAVQLAAIRASAHRPRRGRFGRMESAVDAQMRGQTDVALAQVMSDGGLRRSEAAAALWEDLEERTDGSGRLTIGRSKTSDEPAVVYLTPAAVDDLRWLRQMQPAHVGLVKRLGPRFWKRDRRIFLLTAAQIGRRLRQAAEQAGLAGRFSGHSGRVGMARRMTEKGAPLQSVMLQGRWQSADMPARYIRGERAGEAARWLD